MITFQFRRTDQIFFPISVASLVASGVLFILSIQTVPFFGRGNYDQVLAFLSQESFENLLATYLAVISFASFLVPIFFWNRVKFTKGVCIAGLGLFCSMVFFDLGFAPISSMPLLGQIMFNDQQLYGKVGLAGFVIFAATFFSFRLPLKKSVILETVGISSLVVFLFMSALWAFTPEACWTPTYCQPTMSMAATIFFATHGLGWITNSLAFEISGIIVSTYGAFLAVKHFF